MAQKPLNKAHFLLGCRFDVWIRLLVQNHFRIDRDKRAQAALISASSLLLLPFALLEQLLFAIPVKTVKIKKPPIYIMGHWRSGTTLLQNLMSRDPQFGWFDPVGSTTINNCMLLGWFLGPLQAKYLPDARPMDNLQYGLDMPMEEVFAQLTRTPLAVIHMIAFPSTYEEYMKAAFVTDLTPRQQREWHRTYEYTLKKTTLRKHGRQLLLKSPDNTCRAAVIGHMFPDSKYVNIYRDPYVVIMSTINMFKKQMAILALQTHPSPDFNGLLEDAIVELFARTYRSYFEFEKTLKPGQSVDVCYETFAEDPIAGLRKIYDALSLPGFEDAVPAFEAYVRSQKNYRKNEFLLTESLRQKINSKLGFYFDHYHYEKREGNQTAAANQTGARQFAPDSEIRQMQSSRKQ